MQQRFSSSTFLPRLAIILALVFIAFGTLITISMSAVQRKVERTTHLINQVERTEALVTDLEVSHRMAVNMGTAHWAEKLGAVEEMLHAMDLSEDFASNQTYVARAVGHLEEMDLSHNAMLENGKGKVSNSHSERFRKNSAGLTKQLNSMIFSLRNEHLYGGLNQLETRWSYFMFLFVLACSLALLLAFISNRQKDLISVADQRSEQLSASTNELVRTNEELRETMVSKEEKEMMLKEIHHRVKNNLQIIRSLIRFQAMKVTDPAVEELFNECVNRVSAMAVLHEQTYLSKDLANINVAEYLKMLVQDLTAAYNINMQLDVETDIQVETLGVDTLMPIGLLINEIISNSFKYAFKGRSHGTIKVTLKPNDDGLLDLSVLDDGVGISDLRVWDETETLGMELIKTLVDQLNGSVQLTATSGTAFDIRFPTIAA